MARHNRNVMHQLGFVGLIGRWIFMEDALIAPVEPGGEKDGMRILHVIGYMADRVDVGGELLERCGMPRGTWDGEFATKLEGSDPKHFQTVGA